MMFNLMKKPENAAEEPKVELVTEADQDCAQAYNIEPEMTNSH